MIPQHGLVSLFVTAFEFRGNSRRGVDFSQRNLSPSHQIPNAPVQAHCEMCDEGLVPSRIEPMKSVTGFMPYGGNCLCAKERTQ